MIHIAGSSSGEPKINPEELIKCHTHNMVYRATRRCEKLNASYDESRGHLKGGLSIARASRRRGLVLPRIRCWPRNRGFSAKMDLALPRPEIRGAGLSPPGWCRVPSAWKGQRQHNEFAASTRDLMQLFLRTDYITNSHDMALCPLGDRGG